MDALDQIKELADFIRARSAEDEKLSTPELHARLRIIRAWPDPMGSWTAEQSDAARVMKVHVLQAVAAVYAEHPDYRWD